MNNKKNIFIIILSLFALCACGGGWISGDNSKVSCKLSEVPFSTANAFNMSSDGGYLYVLDRYYDVYRYARNDSRICAFDLDRRTDDPDAKISLDFAKDFSVAGSLLYYYDGISVRRYGDSEWDCGYSMNYMTVTSPYILTAPSHGIAEYKITSSGCSLLQEASFSATRVLAIAANSKIVVALESSGSLTDPPERLSIYDRASGALKASSALSSDKSSSLHFCSATRLRLSNSNILLLDAKCASLGVFNYTSSALEHRLDLSSIGIYNPVDIATVENDLYILTTSSTFPLYMLDISSYTWNQ